MFTSLYHCHDSFQTWLYIWVKRRGSYKKQVLLTCREHMSLPQVYWWVRYNEFAPGLLVGPYYWVCSRFIVGSVLLSLLPVYCWVRVAEVAPGLLVGPCCWGCSRFIGGSVLLIFLVFCVVLLCVFTFWVQCCDVHYDVRIKTMFGSSLPPVVYRSAHY